MHRCVWLLSALAASACAVGVAAAPDRATQRGASIAAKGTAHGAPPCASCHGAKGEGNAAGGFPGLAGLGAVYLERQLAAFSGGQRSSAIMQPIAKALSAEEASAVSRYFAALPTPAVGGTKSGNAPGPLLATAGR